MWRREGEAGAEETAGRRRRKGVARERPTRGVRGAQAPQPTIPPSESADGSGWIHAEMVYGSWSSGRSAAVPSAASRQLAPSSASSSKASKARASARGGKGGSEGGGGGAGDGGDGGGVDGGGGGGAPTW